MNIKELIKSKTFYTGLVSVALGVIAIVFNGDKAGGVEQIAGGILTALGLSSVFLRDAMTKVKVFIEAEEIKQKIK